MTVVAFRRRRKHRCAERWLEDAVLRAVDEEDVGSLQGAELRCQVRGVRKVTQPRLDRIQIPVPEHRAGDFAPGQDVVGDHRSSTRQTRSQSQRPVSSERPDLNGSLTALDGGQGRQQTVVFAGPGPHEGRILGCGPIGQPAEVGDVGDRRGLEQDGNEIRRRLKRKVVGGRNDAPLRVAGTHRHLGRPASRHPQNVHKPRRSVEHARASRRVAARLADPSGVDAIRPVDIARSRVSP